MKRFVLSMFFFALASHAAWAGDPLQKMAREFGRSMSTLKKPRVGILSFPYHDGKISSGSTILSERLTTYMADVKNIRVIERTLLKKVLEEQHLAESGAFDASSVQAVGKVLDVDVVVTGTLNDLEGNKTELNARILRSDTGEVLAAQRVIVNRVWSDSPHRKKSASRTSTVHVSAPKPVSNEKIEIGFPGGRAAPASRAR